MMKPTLGPKDIHVVVNGKDNKEKVFAYNKAEPLKVFDVFPHGVNGPRQDVRGGDTVEQLYLLGKPQWTQPHESITDVKRPYGWVFIPMGDYEGKEAELGREGFGAHGGGHISDYWQPRQALTYTMGCVRHHNEDVRWLAELVERTHAAGGKVWMSVDQPGGGGTL